MVLTDRHTHDRPSIAAVIIVRDEESDLPGLFENLEDIVDEIVIVDDGSTDRTRELSLSAGAQVTYVSAPRGQGEHFCHQRNKGIQASRADWLLHMDADERVTPELAVEIREAVRDTPLRAFRYRRLNFFLHRPMRGGGWQDWNKPHLARRGFHRFVNEVHEECLIQGGGPATGQLQGLMWHLNDSSYEERMRKSAVYCRYQATRLERRGMVIRAGHLLTLPLAEFLRKYIIRAGFRDRLPGLIWAMHSATAMFRACALLWDRQNRIARDVLEDALRSRGRRKP